MFKSKVIIITGSSTGIGAGTAVKFASEEASGIVLHGRNEEALNKVKEQCEKAGKGNSKIYICVGDIRKQETRESLVKAAIAQFGRLDVLVNNAGINKGLADFHEAKIDSFDEIFDVNVRSAVTLTKLALPHLIESKGNIVNVSSVGGFKVHTGYGYYCMSKAALDHFTRCLAVELGPKGVRVNSVNTGLIKGTEAASRQPGAKKMIEYGRQIIKTYPLRRSGTVDEVADAILYLASHKANFITGVTFPVDGGAKL